MIEYKDNIFTKIKNFFKGLFSKNKYEKIDDITVQNSMETQNINETHESIKEEINASESKTESYETDKKDFFKIYEKAKKRRN